VRYRIALLAPLALFAFVSTGAQGSARAPRSAAAAWAIHVTVPNGSGAGTPTVSAPPPIGPATGGPFVFPADGSVVSAQSTFAAVTAKVVVNASAKAESDVTGLSLFGGEITADAITARASAGTGYSGAGGNANGSTVANLKALGQPVTGGHVALADWGDLAVGVQGVDRAAPVGAKGYRGFVTELDIKLTAEHGGLPAGSELQIGYAEAAAQTQPPSEQPGQPTSTTPTVTITQESDEPPLGDRPERRPLIPPKNGHVPLTVIPKLTAGRYVFPVYGPSSYIDTFGAARADVTYHHGDDIFGQLGQPLVACADGTIFSVGWNKIGGNRLWLLDQQGNQFYYAHLSAFSTLAVNGAHVKAGQVIGFMGQTGDAEGTPVHLHFEIHPVSLLYLGYDGAVDPTAYLDAWQHQRDLPFPIAASWVAAVAGGRTVPEPGAILLGMTDISSADGLDPASLQRALLPQSPRALMQTLVPTPLPSRDLGRG
jgi:murein DD-endopeptidase MepM/ murein hydrolase activator NlpD